MERMESATTELAAVMNRLEKLEVQNRRMKQIGALAVILIGSVFLMGQASPPRTIEANEFVLRDSGGQVRARLYMNMWGTTLPDSFPTPAYMESPILALFDAGGTKRAELSLSEGGAPAIGGGFPRLLFFDDLGYPRLSLFSGPTAGLDIARPLTLIKGMEPVISLRARPSGGVELTLSRGRGLDTELDTPRLSISDAEGFETVIGSTSLVTPHTGESHKTSAASIVLFDKDKNVLWKAP